MGRMVDVDDLIDSAEVAVILGLSHRNSVRTYRARYDDFPHPVVDMGSGRCLLFLRPEIKAFKARHRGRLRSAPK